MNRADSKSVRDRVRDAEIAWRHIAGETYAAIGASLGISRERVHVIVRREGVPIWVTSANESARRKRVAVSRRVDWRCENCGRVLRTAKRYRRKRFCSRACVGAVKRIPTDALIAHMQKLASELGYTPGFSDIDRAGGPSRMVYVHRFGSLREAQRAAGFPPAGPGTPGHRVRPTTANEP